MEDELAFKIWIILIGIMYLAIYIYTKNRNE